MNCRMAEYIVLPFLVQITPRLKVCKLDHYKWFYDTFPSEKFDLDLLVLHYFS